MNFFMARLNFGQNFQSPPPRLQTIFFAKFSFPSSHFQSASLHISPSLAPYLTPPWQLKNIVPSLFSPWLHHILRCREAPRPKVRFFFNFSFNSSSSSSLIIQNRFRVNCSFQSKRALVNAFLSLIYGFIVY